MFSSVKSLVVVGCLAVAALAQNINIALPPQSATMSPGSNITVQVERPDTLTGSTEVGIAICLASCEGHPGGCSSFDVTQQLGSVLYTGGYNPQFGSGEWYPFQNFTVQVPQSFATGDAVLSVTQLALVGAGPYPYLQTVNTTVTIA